LLSKNSHFRPWKTIIGVSPGSEPICMSSAQTRGVKWWGGGTPGGRGELMKSNHPKWNVACGCKKGKSTRLSKGKSAGGGVLKTGENRHPFRRLCGPEEGCFREGETIKKTIATNVPLLEVRLLGPEGHQGGTRAAAHLLEKSDQHGGNQRNAGRSQRPRKRGGCSST